MPRNYTPLKDFCFAKPYTPASKSGLIIKGQDSEIYEIVKMPPKLSEQYEGKFDVGTKFIVKNGWRGIKVYKEIETSDTVFCIDFASIIATVE